jgi:hypothetical protein
MRRPGASLEQVQPPPDRLFLRRAQARGTGGPAGHPRPPGLAGALRARLRDPRVLASPSASAAGGSVAQARTADAARRPVSPRPCAGARSRSVVGWGLGGATWNLTSGLRGMGRVRPRAVVRGAWVAPPATASRRRFVSPDVLGLVAPVGTSIASTPGMPGSHTQRADHRRPHPAITTNAHHAPQPHITAARGASTYHPGFSANGLAPDSVVMIWRRRRPFQERLCPPSLQKMRGTHHRDRVDPRAHAERGQWRERAAPAPNRVRTGRLGLAVSRRGRQLARRQKTCTSAQRISRPDSGGSRAEPGRWELEGGTECLPRRLASRGAPAAKKASASHGAE